ncbi:MULTISPECIES: DUF5819 family protein [unclassified Streptomyces]|uniref:DUF5819 family protein n=1 Tax=unclassified Streptomyces TaxID=2593676 RepID=UPI00093FA892|nr:DUF5819 family protein [Streptomyces sp. CB02400]OKK10163.1 hypothetical protein AMK33_14575 [Streptomyces sp. CB02400]
MDAYDKGSNARHGPAGPSAGPGGPEPGAALPGPAAPAESAAPAGSPAPGALPPGTGRPEGLPHSPADPDAGPHAAPGPPAGTPSAGPPAGPRTGVAALSLRYQIGAAVALAVVAVTVCVHLGMTFLHVAPANTVSKKHGETVENWIYPEFEQNWKLFAPNPLQQDIAVQVRAEIRTADGGTRTTGWYDLSAQDGRAIDGNLLPSHTQQNELRRAWDFFAATHDDDNRPVGLRGALSETYLRRIAVLRLDRADAAGPGGAVERVQIRSRTAQVPPPEWSGEKISTTPVYRTLSWWSLPEDEARGGAG